MRKHLLTALLLCSGMPLCGSFTAMAAPEPQAQTQGVESITGTVFDENNEPVAGATVSAPGMKGKGVMTDAFGHFTLRTTPGAKLTVTFVGYKSATVAAARDVQVYLQPTTEVLDQMVVVGYGQQKRANLTGAVATVDVARTMDSRPVQDVTRALQGAVPGLSITTGNGDIAGAPDIRIRGVGSLSASGQASSPLIVVDGVPVDDMSFLNPEDIADISVLKDAASSAIYGSRASFGVILITTKTAASKDRVSVNYNNNFGWSSATVVPAFAHNVDQLRTAMSPFPRGTGDKEIFGLYFADLLPYMEKWEAQHNGPYTSYVELKPYVDDNNVGDYRVLDNGTWLRYADWDIAKTMLRTAPMQKHNVSLEGTSGKTQYRLSFGYDSKEDMMRYNPDKMHRYMANMSVSTQIFKWLQAGARFNFSQKNNTTPGDLRNTYQYMWRWPGFFENYGYMLDAEGNKIPTRSPLGYRLVAGSNETITAQTRMQAWMRATLLPGLDLYGDFTYTTENQNSDDYRVPGNLFNTWQAGMGKIWSPYTQATSYAAQSNYRDASWVTNIYATYAKSFAGNNFKLMAGFSADQGSYKSFYAKRMGLVDFNLPNINLTNGSEGTSYSVSGTYTKRATAGFFGRFNYDFMDRYLFEANVRRDASSKFPENQMWATFPSFSAGWRFSEEAFMAPTKSWLSNGKLRASWGQIGNEAVGSYRFLSTASQVSAGSVHWLNGTAKVTEYGMPTVVSNSLKWETIETSDLGLDLGFLNNSLTAGFDVYMRDTKDMLGPSSDLPAVLGAGAPYSNNGQLRTMGWELNLGYNQSFGDADVWVTANLSDSRTKIQKWNNTKGTIYTYNPSSGNYTEGQYYGDIWGLETDRYFEESDFVKGADGKLTYAPGVADQTWLQTGSFIYGPGDIKFVDQNGDGVINNGDAKMTDAEGNLIPVGTLANCGDLKVIGNALPRYEYSFRFGGAWKGLDIDFFFQGVGKRSMWNTGSLVVPMAQSNLGVFTHQLSYNTYDLDANGKIIGYNVDQNNMYPAMYNGAQGAGKFSTNVGNGCYNFYPQSRYLLNMAYLRFKNLTIGYTLPVDITKKALIQKARLYFSAENIAFLYNGAGKYNLDAEIARGYGSAVGVNDGYAGFGRTTPMPRTFSFGVQVTL